MLSVTCAWSGHSSRMPPQRDGQGQLAAVTAAPALLRVQQLLCILQPTATQAPGLAALCPKLYGRT